MRGLRRQWSAPRILDGVARRGAFAFAAARMLAATLPKRLSGGKGAPEVVLHAGQHKTGSTSLQLFILKHRADLAGKGIHVVRTGQSVAGDHHRLLTSALNAAGRSARLSLLGLEFSCAHPARPLISSEVAAEIILAGNGHRLIDRLRSAGASRVHLLLYLRSPFALANATYSEVISGLQVGGPVFSEYLPSWNETAYAQYERFLELGERGDVDLIVRPYTSRARRSIARDFQEALGAGFPFEEEPRVNASLGPVALEAIRLLAAELGPPKREHRWLLSERLRTVGRALGEKPFWGMDSFHESLAPDADRRTDFFAQAVWGKGWREVVGEERRELNVFDPFDEEQRALLDATLARMRAALAQ